MDTFTIVLLGWGLYSVISYFEKRGERGKAILSTMLISFVIVLGNSFGNFFWYIATRFTKTNNDSWSERTNSFILHFLTRTF